MTSTCLMIDSGSPFADATLTALAPQFGRVLRAGGPADADMPELSFDLLDEAGWNRLSQAVADRYESVDAVVVCAPSPELEETREISRQWFALREMLRLLPVGERGVFLSQHLAPDDRFPAREAALEAQRISMAAAVVDGIGLERRPRANRLVIDPQASPAAVGEAARFLCDTRSSFMCGAEIALDTTPSSGDAKLEGRTVLITGATSGLGLAAALSAARLGAFVAVGGRKAPLAEETLARIRAEGGDGMIASIVERRGGLHGLVNNAGESVNRRLDLLTAADLEFLLNVNFRGTLLGMTAAEPVITASGGGAIVNISSVAGIRGGPGSAAYSATKAAVIGHSRARGRVLAAQSPRIRVNALQPGLIWSDSVAASLGEEGAAAFRARIEPITPLGRVTTPAEVAEPVCWLLSDAAALKVYNSNQGFRYDQLPPRPRQRGSLAAHRHPRPAGEDAGL
jgi:NAD(P)-dependent dehydrogenase (short-subunit alcohol dehydrogenase family)